MTTRVTRKKIKNTCKLKKSKKESIFAFAENTRRRAEVEAEAEVTSTKLPKEAESIVRVTLTAVRNTTKVTVVTMKAIT